MTDDTLFVLHCSFHIQQHTQWASEMRQVSQQVKDMGFFGKILSDLLPVEALDKWKPLENSPETPLKLFHFTVILIGAGIGYGVATVSFVIERAVGKKTK